MRAHGGLLTTEEVLKQCLCLLKANAVADLDRCLAGPAGDPGQGKFRGKAILDGRHSGSQKIQRVKEPVVGGPTGYRFQGNAPLALAEPEPQLLQFGS